jgi:serine/threonine protein kinase
VNECPKCKERFADPGFCPHDGSTLIARAESEDPAHSDDLVTHGGQGTGTLTGSAVESVLKKVVETRKAERLVGVELDGRYRIEKQIGEGGMGVVFLARHMVIEKPVAIKVLRAEVATDEGVVKRFVQEARAASRIGHPNIIDVTDFGTTKDGLTYQVMEYLEGKTLARLLAEEGTLDLPRALNIMAQMARALGAAHKKGIVHRDLKPENVFLMERDGRSDFVKIVDFGIAKVQPPEGDGASPRLTRVGTVFGTPEYMSPEQASGRTDVDLRADIYALGVILYEMLCGRVPHRGDTTVRTLAMQMLDEPMPMREARPDLEITDDQEGVVLRSLAKKRDKRYQDMAEFLNALEDVTTHTELDLPKVMEEERRLSGEQLSQRAFDTVPEAEVEESMRQERSTSAHELAANAVDEKSRPRRASRATDPVFLRDNRASAMPQYDVVEAEESGPMMRSESSHIWPVLITLLLVGGAVAAFVLTRDGEKASPVAIANFDAAVAVASAPPDAMVLSPDAAAPVDAGIVGPPDARRRGKHKPDKPDKPDNTVVTLPPDRGTQEIKIYTEPSGAELFIGNTYAGPDGLRMRRKFGDSYTVTCHLKGYLDGSVKVRFNGKRSIYECKLKKRRVKKCVEGTKNPFDDCP